MPAVCVLATLTSVCWRRSSGTPASEDPGIVSSVLLSLAFSMFYPIDVKGVPSVDPKNEKTHETRKMRKTRKTRFGGNDDVVQSEVCSLETNRRTSWSTARTFTRGSPLHDTQFHARGMREANSDKRRKR